MQLLGTGSQRAGKASQVLANGTALAFASWQANVKGTDLVTTNFESYDLATDTTYGEGILGDLNCDLSFGGDWDAAENPLDDPPGLFPRDNLPNLEFVVNQTDANFWSFHYARLRNCSSNAKWDGKVEFTCDGHNQGVFAFPLGSN